MIQILKNFMVLLAIIFFSWFTFLGMAKAEEQKPPNVLVIDVPAYGPVMLCNTLAQVNAIVGAFVEGGVEAATAKIEEINGLKSKLYECTSGTVAFVAKKRFDSSQVTFKDVEYTVTPVAIMVRDGNEWIPQYSYMWVPVLTLEEYEKLVTKSKWQKA